MTVKKYVKKPVVIEAMQFKKGMTSEEVRSFVKDAAIGFIGSYNIDDKYICTSCEIATLEGSMRVSDGDYIIKGIKGEFYPCKPDIFKDSYAEVGYTGNIRRQELGIFSMIFSLYFLEFLSNGHGII